MKRITRDDKIELFVEWYRRLRIKYTLMVIRDIDASGIFPVLNRIIIDSVGITGLKEVKKRAWKGCGSV